MRRFTFFWIILSLSTLIQSSILCFYMMIVHFMGSLKLFLNDAIFFPWKQFDEQKDQVTVEQILRVVFLDPERPSPVSTEILLAHVYLCLLHISFPSYILSSCTYSFNYLLLLMWLRVRLSVSAVSLFMFIICLLIIQ